MMQLKIGTITFDTLDISIFVINFLAFALQIWMSEWQSSIMAFVIFSLVLGVLFFETYTAYWRTKSSLDIWSKLILYVIIVYILFLKWWAIWITNLQIGMLVVCIIGLLVRQYIKHLEIDHRLYIVLIIQNIAITFWTIAYCIAVYENPYEYWWLSIIFWILHILVYLVTLYWIYKKQEPLPTYLFQWYWIFRCLLHIIFILIF